MRPGCVTGSSERKCRRLWPLARNGGAEWPRVEVLDESGRFEVYVRPFPEGEGKRPVSRNGGEDPRWSRDGKELFYVEGDTLVAVAVETTPAFSAGEASRLFSDLSLQQGNYPNYDVSPDGRRFVTVETVENATPAIHVVQNWFEEFRGRAQD